MNERREIYESYWAFEARKWTGPAAWLMRTENEREAQLWLGDRATWKHAKDCWSGRGNDNLGWNDLQMYFKVIKSGTNQKLVYDFLLLVYSNCCRITHRF